MKRSPSPEELKDNGANKKQKTSVLVEILKAVNNDNKTILSNLISAHSVNILNELNEQDLHVIHIAAFKNSVECFKYLIEEININILMPTAKKFIPLHFAASTGSLETLKYIVEKLLPHNIDAADIKGLSALHMGSSQGHVKVVELLLEKGAKIDAANIGGADPLHAAALQGHVKVVELLLEKGAKIEAEKQGMTALHAAAFRGHVKVAELLLENGAKIDALDNQGNSPLLVALSFKRLDYFKLLLEHNADTLKVEGELDKLPVEYTNWLKAARIIKDICLLNTNRHSDIFPQMAANELSKFACKFLENYLVKNGFKVGYNENFKEICKALPQGLQRSLISHLDILNNTAKEHLEVLEGCLIDNGGKLINMPYSSFIKYYKEGSNKNSITHQAFLKLYEDNPHYKTPGLCFMEYAETKSNVPSVESELNYRMLTQEGVEELVFDLNKCVLPIRIKHKLEKVLTIHKQYKMDSSLITICLDHKQIVELKETITRMSTEMNELKEDNQNLHTKVDSIESKLEYIYEFVASLTSGSNNSLTDAPAATDNNGLITNIHSDDNNDIEMIGDSNFH